MRKKTENSEQITNKPTEQLSLLIEKANLLPLDEWMFSSKTLIARVHFYRTGNTIPESENPYGDAQRQGYRYFSLLPKENTVNSKFPNFPSEMDLLTTDELSKEFDEFYKSEQEALEILKLRLKDYPSLFDYVFPVYLDLDKDKISFSDYIKKPFERFDELLYLKSSLFSIVFKLGDYVKTGESYEKSAQYKQLGYIDKDSAPERSFGVDAKGQIVFEPDPVEASLKGVDARRLRVCPICKVIFWAYRLNQKVCSRKCSNAWHQRRFLSKPKNREQYNEKRRNSYAYNQAVKEDK